MASFADLGQIARSDEFLRRVAYAMGVAAAAVYSESIQQTGSITATTVITMSNTTGVSPGMVASGPGVPNGTLVVSVSTNVSVTLNVATTLTISGVTFTFSTTQHSARSAFAARVANGQYDLNQTCVIVLGNPTITAEANLTTIPGNAIPDTDIQFAVNSLWSLFAGAPP